MKAGEISFQQLLDGKVQYRVPLFQRTYSWTQDNWERLWDDTLDIYALDPPRPHFIGAIVTLPLPDSPEHATKHMLIDGQQRMTTLLVLLAAVRDFADKTDNLRDEIQEECLVNKHAKREDERTKLRPTQKDLATFDSLIVRGEPGAATQISRAYHFFKEALGAGDLEGKPIKLARLKECISSYLSLVSIKVEAEDSPHRIFESLNNTGTALSASDLVRNHVFMRIPN